MNLNRHMRSVSYMLGCMALLIGLPHTFASPGPSHPSVTIHVAEQFDGHIPREFARGLHARQLPLFMDEFVVHDDQIFDVSWTPPEQGLPSGVVVLFEYRHPHLGEPSTMSIEYEGDVLHPQIARFIVPRTDVARWGPVTAWRVRIRHTGRTIAQQASTNWK